MFKSKKREIESISEKPCWHPYNLQKLTLERFIRVANKILEDEFEILDIREEKSTVEE